MAGGAPVAPRLRSVGIVAAVAGGVLFAWAIRAVGSAAVLDEVRHLGAGFFVVLLLGGVRHLVRTVAWRLCLDRSDRIPFRAAFAAYLAGDALGNVTPFGFLISEPSKIVLVRKRVAPEASISALTIENLFYSASVAFMLVAGTVALLVAFDVPRPARIAAIATVGLAGTISAAVAWIVWTRRRVVSRLLPRFEQIGRIEDRIHAFAGRHPGKLLPILALEATFHASAVAEIWFVLLMMTGTAPPLLTAFVLEYVNRTITVAFQFVPMWLGVDEVGTGLATSVLQFGPAVGVSLALVRKARTALWTAAGLALLLTDSFARSRDGEPEHHDPAHGERRGLRPQRL